MKYFLGETRGAAMCFLQGHQDSGEKSFRGANQGRESGCWSFERKSCLLTAPC